MKEISANEKMAFLIKKAEELCSRNELCEYDVIQKLTAWKCSGSEVDEVLKHLRENGFVDNARYSKSYAIGKNHQLKWGRTKISYQLRMKRIDQRDINEGLWFINEEEYLEQLCRMAGQKWRSLHDADRYTREGKLTVYLQGKGYEPYAIKHAIEKLDSAEE